MKLPAWLYAEHRDEVVRLRRFGSRGICLVILEGRMIAPSYTLGVGRLGIQYGPAEGIRAGHADLPDDCRSRIWERSDGLGFGISWEAARR